MNENWKPGDVAMVTLVEPGFNPRRGSGPHLMVRDVSGVKDVWRLAMTGIVHEEREVANTRRLVVIDPELDDDGIDRLAGLLDCSPARIRAALREYANPTPPKPEEPTGLGAVVRVDSSQGIGLGKKLLVRGHATHEPWMGDNQKRDWDQIDGPIEIVSEGVTE